MNIIYAISSGIFAAIFLLAVMAYGGDIARNVAIFSAFIACISQFTAQDPASYKLSIYSAYAAFVLGLFSYLALVTGN